MDWFLCQISRGSEQMKQHCSFHSLLLLCFFSVLFVCLISFFLPENYNPMLQDWLVFSHHWHLLIWHSKAWITLAIILWLWFQWMPCFNIIRVFFFTFNFIRFPQRNNTMANSKKKKHLYRSINKKIYIKNEY